MSKNIAIITGASAGLGKSFAEKLSTDYQLVLIARNEEKLNALAKTLPNDPIVLAADLADTKGLKNVERHISKRDEIIADLISGIDSLIASKRWKIGSAILSIPYKLLFKKPPNKAFRYLKRIRRKYQKIEKPTTDIDAIELLELLGATSGATVTKDYIEIVGNQ